MTDFDRAIHRAHIRDEEPEPRRWTAMHWALLAMSLAMALTAWVLG